MNSKKLIVGTLIGAIVLFLLGYLFYANLLADYFAANMSGMEEFSKDPPDLLFIFIGNICTALMLSYIFIKWAGIKTFSTGVKAGAIIGLLASLGYNFIFYGTTTIPTLELVAVDSLVTMVMLGIAGGFIGMVLGKMDSSN